MDHTLIDAAFRGAVLIVLVYAALMCFRLIGAAFMWARRHLLRSIGRASGRLVGASRGLVDGFKDGLSKKD